MATTLRLTTPLMGSSKAASVNKEVKEVQTALKTAGFFTGVIDGIYGKITRSTVIKFQQVKGLKADGIVGQQTRNALKPVTNLAVEPKTTHFKLSEFRCKDGTAVPKSLWGNVQKIMNALEKVRKEFGHKPITINSGYRTISYNRKVGGAPSSRHLVADAADIRIAGVTPAQVYAKLNVMFPNNGVGRYANFTHLDMRNGRARW